MRYKAILFDLDGTLLPMEQSEFVNGYFKELAKKVCPLGIDSKTLIDSIWAGTAAMVKNDGTKSNYDVFWNYFKGIHNIDLNTFKEYTEDFYSNEFKIAKNFTGDNPYAVTAVEFARKAADTVILATNPVFPMAGQKTRLSFIGLTPDSFDLVTSYESDCYCKPNPKYFLSICERMNLEPSDCLMIGNDEKEDMYAAGTTGMDTFLVTDCMILDKDNTYEGKRGTFLELIKFLEDLHCNN